MRRFFCLIIGLYIGVPPLCAQDIGDYISLYDYGAGLDWISTIAPTIRYTDNDEGETIPTVGSTGLESVTAYGAWLGFNFPIMQLDDNLSMGLSPSVTLFAMMLSQTSEDASSSYFGDGGVGYTIPIMATLKYGTDAQYKSRMKFGLTFGVGYRYTSYIVTSNGSTPSAFGVPIMMGEFNFKMGKKLGLMKIRYLTSLAKGRDRYDLELSQSSIYIAYTPNW